jgi:hypothetical protein
VQGVVIADPVYANGQFLVTTDDGKVTAFSADIALRAAVPRPYGASSTLEKAPFHRPGIIRNNDDAFYALSPEGLLSTLSVPTEDMS